MIKSSSIITGCTLSCRKIKPNGKLSKEIISTIRIAGILIPKPEKVIFNPPATIILWEDGTKTVVKAMKGAEFNPYYGFTAEVTKKVCGSNSRVSDLVEHGEWWPRPKPARTESLNCKEEK